MYQPNSPEKVQRRHTVYFQTTDHPRCHTKYCANESPGQHSCPSKLTPGHCQGNRYDRGAQNYSPEITDKSKNEHLGVNCLLDVKQL